MDIITHFEGGSRTDNGTSIERQIELERVSGGITLGIGGVQAGRSIGAAITIDLDEWLKLRAAADEMFGL
jgi:hypothetical protein